MDRFIQNSITYVKIKKSPEPIGKEGSGFFLGSCFAESLFDFYKNHYLDCLFSPFGNIYNPVSLAQCLESLCRSEPVREQDIFRHRELWRHFNFDTRLCTTDKEKYLLQINNAGSEAHEFLKNSSYLFLTLGTSFVYINKKNNQVVNNCHKLPGSDFTRVNMPIPAMSEALAGALQKVRDLNPDIKIILTLSPVRHLRDSAEENSLSKARLRCLIDELTDSPTVWYFPAYEILLDQLRDYRWYDNDLAHPSQKAVQYIMDRFIDAAADEDLKNYLEDVNKMNSLLSHRVLHETDESEKFRRDTVEKFAQLITRYPTMNKLKGKFDSLFSGNH